MATLGKQPDTVMMAWYRAKKFGIARPSFASESPQETVAGAVLITGTQTENRAHGSV